MLTDDLASQALDLSLATAKPLREIQIDLGTDDTIRIPDAHLMFQGEYRKEGFDLVIEDETTRLVINDYFRAAKRPALESDGGARLTEDVVAALAVSEDGLRYAQATPPAQQAAIGRVETVTGQATVIRNGTPVVLNRGDMVFKGDVVQTDPGSSLGITFVDGSTFSLGAGARMVLNDMVYQQGGTQNSALLNIVQGSVTFLAGQVAKTGDMRVGTPVATMGIRGTLVGADVNAQDGTTKFSVKPEQDGRVGSFELIREGRVIAIISRAGEVTTVTPSGAVLVTALTPAEQQADQLAMAIVYQIVSLAAANPLMPGALTGPRPDAGQGGAGSSNPVTPDNNGTLVPETTPPPPPLARIFGPSGTDFAIATPEAPAAALLTPPVILAGGERLVSVIGGSRVEAAANSTLLVPGQFGELTINPDGSARYTTDPRLAEGQTRQDTFTFVYDDGGTTREETRTYQAVGVNDAPVVIVSTAPEASVAEGEGTQASVNLLRRTLDPDDGETGTLRIEDVRFSLGSADPSPTAPPGVTPPGTPQNVDPANPAFDHLPAGVTETITVSYRVVDVHGASVEQSVFVTVTGTNDLPVVTSHPAAAGEENGQTFSLDLLGGASDPDDGETGTLTIEDVRFSVGSDDPSPTAPPGVSLTGTTLIVDPANPAFDHLLAGATETITVSYRVVDLHGAGVQQSVSVTVTGTNDLPLVTSSPAAGAEENGQTVSVDLLGGASDPDDGETGTLTIEDVRFSVAGGQASTTAPPGVTLSGTTLIVDPANPVFDHLPAGVTETITVSYRVVDIHGAGVEQSVSVTVTGTNDLPVVASSPVTGAEENGQPVSVDLLAGASDPDDGEAGTLAVQNLTFSVDGAPATDAFPAGVTLSGSTLTVDPADPGFESLAAGDVRRITVSYDVVDPQGARVSQTATLLVNGSNDAPTAAADPALVTAGQSVAAATRAAGLLGNDSDPDRGETALLKVVSVAAGSGAAPVTADSPTTINGLYGTLTIAADGTYSYLADRAQALAEGGAQGFDHFRYGVADPHGGSAEAVLTFAITGVNDAPTATSNATAATEDLEATGNVLLDGTPDADPDEGDALTVSQVSQASDPAGTATASGSITTAYGRLTINRDGGYTYLANGAAAQALAAGATAEDAFIYTIQDGHGATSSATLSFTVTGANDGPQATADPASVTAGETVAATSRAAGLLGNDTDPDAGETQALTIIAAAPGTGESSPV
ncbi:MAG: hypothetical protein JWQ36_495, partial [Enterovirga sp.]|nr:hypothetical protein [Enterovirga sp.]